MNRDEFEKVIDIRDYENIISKNESPLANAVTVSNAQILDQITKYSRLLEVGCGHSSFIFSNIINKQNWYGIDILQKDSRGRNSIATKIGSVDNIPYNNNFFDYIVSNQSIEHWHEYSVSYKDAINELYRVLKPQGSMLINFPLFLHGHPMFVRGKLSKIVSLFDSRKWTIKSKTLFIDSKIKNYRGWRLCGFPDFYINRYSNCSSSYVAELKITKINDDKLLVINNNKNKAKKLFKKKSLFLLYLMHGVDIIIWKIYQKIKKIM